MSEVEATPAAEAKAEEAGVDLGQVEGSGAEGRVLVKDVEAAAESGDVDNSADPNAHVQTGTPEDPRADDQPEGSDVARRVHPDTGGYQYTGE